MVNFNNFYGLGPGPENCRAGLVIFNGTAWIVSNPAANPQGLNTAAMNTEITTQPYPAGATNIAA